MVKYKTIIINNQEFVINPNKLPFFTGFQRSLGDMFTRLQEKTNIEVLKQILMVGSHYTTWEKISIDKGEPVWAYWGKPIIIYDDWKIDAADYVYFYEGIEVGKEAFLQESIYYTGTRNGIFANERSNVFHRYDSDLIGYMNFLDENDEYYYLAAGRFVDKDSKQYVLKK